MLDISLGNTLSKSDFEQLDNSLRTRLLAFQDHLKSVGTPLLIVIHGLDGSGKGVFLTELGARMNPRLFRTYSFWDNDSCHSTLPFFARYWNALPAKGSTSIHLGAWYERLFDKALAKGNISADLETVRNFEQSLADNGARIVKIFLHLDKKTQKNRLDAKKKLLSTDSKIQKMKESRSKSYSKTSKVHDEILTATHKSFAPWHVIDATNLEWLLAKSAELILGIDIDSTSTTEPVEIPYISNSILSEVSEFPVLDRGTHIRSVNSNFRISFSRFRGRHGSRIRAPFWFLRAGTPPERVVRYAASPRPSIPDYGPSMAPAHRTRSRGSSTICGDIGKRYQTQAKLQSTTVLGMAVC
jgi:polyphosphate kinase 2 (PPK2 family)